MKEEVIETIKTATLTHQIYMLSTFVMGIVFLCFEVTSTKYQESVPPLLTMLFIGAFVFSSYITYLDSKK